jgi:predicted ferric reductase
VYKKILIGALVAVFLVLAFVGLQSAFGQSADATGSIVVHTIPGPTLAQKVADQASNSLPWYIVRGSGIVAAVALVILMLSGIGFISGQSFKFLEPITAWASHRALGIVFGISILLHMGALLFDKFVPFNLLTLLVPWLSNYKPVSIFGFHVGSIYIALGVLSFYLVAFIIITSLLVKDKKPYLWKIVHLLSYVAMLFVFVHALYLGTDLASGFWRVIWIVVGLVVGALTIYRLWRAKTV